MVLSQRFTDALVYAAQLHATQMRKGSGVPYVAHLLGVTAIALEHGAGEDEAIAALLHDAVEDQGGAATREEIRRRYGETVAAIVDGCTDADVVPKPPWRKRKEAYIAHLQTAPRSVHLVSASDKLHNARTIVEDYRTMASSVWSRFKGGRDGTVWYYRSLVDVYRQQAKVPAALIDALEREVKQIEELASSEKTGMDPI